MIEVNKMLKPKINSEKKINILLYHQVGVSPTIDSNLDCFCSKSEFYRQMKFLKQSKYSVISLNNAIDIVNNSKHIDKDYVVLTFDDGCESFYDVTFPILDSFDFPASVYPITGFLGEVLEINGKNYKHLKILSKNMLLELSEKGVHIGAHSVNHHKLTQLSISDAEHEIKNSKAHLEQLLGQHIDSFSFPHGNYNKQIINILKDNDFSNALTCKSGFAQNAQSIFEIPRKYITYFDTLEIFKQKLNKND